MRRNPLYTDQTTRDAVTPLVKEIDGDIERAEDILMLGLGIVMLLPLFAPIAPPKVLLPLVAVIFAVSASLARLQYFKIERKLATGKTHFDAQWHSALGPLNLVFKQNPMPSLAVSFNPLKNITRTWKSILGGIFLNPFWFPIFYVMGMQMVEERNFAKLNQALIEVEYALGLLELPEQDEYPM